MTILEIAELASKIKTRLTAEECAQLLACLTQGHYLDATGTVLLGDRALADAQRAADDAAGGLVRLACGYGR